MKREDVLAILTRHKSDLKSLGVSRAALFGSVARGTETGDSDIDILVDIDKDLDIGVLNMSASYSLLKACLRRQWMSPIGKA